MGYNKNFELGLRDIELIENALEYQMSRLTEQRRTHVESTIVPESELDSVKQIDAGIKELRELLGRIHNQKVWYRPQGVYVSG